MKGKTLSANLKRLRSINEYSQQKIAEMTGISRVAYVKIENGTVQNPKIATIDAIAESLGVTINDLYKPMKQLVGVRFRSNADLSKKDLLKKDELKNRIAVWLENYNNVEVLLGAQSNYLFEGFSEKDPVKAAALARSILGINSTSPIGPQITNHIIHAGIKLFLADEHLNLKQYFGLSVNQSGGGPAIAVRTKEVTVERQIFTVAHELGHLLLHSYEYDGDENLTEDKSSKEEREADIFAASFLMPDSLFQEQWERARVRPFVERVLIVKKFFGVSYRTVLHRLVESDKYEYDNSIYYYFNVEFKKKSSRGLKDHFEPAALDELDFVYDRYKSLVYQALEEKLIVREKASELLDIKVEDLVTNV